MAEKTWTTEQIAAIASRIEDKLINEADANLKREEKKHGYSYRLSFACSSEMGTVQRFRRRLLAALRKEQNEHKSIR